LEQRKRFANIYKTTKSEIEIACLLTSVNQQYQRLYDGVGVELLQQQAESIGLPLEIMQIQRLPTMESTKMREKH
jgi:diphthamide synthase (EF-2-diphthine--ammonia ligase)